MDPLSEIIALLRPRAAVAKPITARGEWGVRYQAHDAPGFTIVLAGEAWLVLEGGQPLRLARGDFLLLPTTPAFALCSTPGVACTPVEPRMSAVRHGDQEGEPDFVALGGSFAFERVNAPLLLALLPGLIHVSAAHAGAPRLGRLIELLAEECLSERPGKELIVESLLEVLLVEALRSHRDGGAIASPGLLNGLRDPALSRALRAMHADVRARWTVGALAATAGMSRSAFAARFRDSVGCGPIEHLARWRMAIARDALARGTKSIDRIAEDIGFESASAFSTAFRKRIGCAPGRFARAQAAGAQGQARSP